MVLENRSRDYVEQRIRAGVLEQGTVDVLTGAGVGERLQREGIVHGGIHLQFAGERHHLPLSELTGGRHIVIYGQTEVVKDLVEARLDASLPLLFEVSDVAVHDFEFDAPFVTYAHEDEQHRPRLRRDRGVRRLPRRLPAGDRARAARVLARLPVRLARHPRGGAAVERGARLRAPRPRVRAAQPAFADAQPALHPVPPGRGSRRVAGRAHLGRAAPAHGARRLGR